MAVTAAEVPIWRSLGKVDDGFIPLFKPSKYS
jgi:hypothetical protein